MSPPGPLSAIPTISDLYKDGTLHPTNTSDISSPLPPPSATLNSKISLIRTSITTLATTSIVNAANTSLCGGGGVDGAIHSAAGPSLLTECRTLNGCPTGSAKITSAHALPCKYIIHAVGPIYYRAKKESPSRPAELLTSCYRTSLELAREKGGSIAFSCLSTGVYGYPSGEAAEVACREVRRFLEEEGGELERVVFCCFEAKDERAYEAWLPKIFPPTPEDLPAAAESTEPTDQPDKTGPTTTENPSTSAPAPKKPKTASEEIDKDWEAVDKPSEPATDISEDGEKVDRPSEAESEKATDISDEGEKVEAPDLGADDGEKVEKPVPKEPVDELAESGEVLPKSGLLKDW